MDDIPKEIPKENIIDPQAYTEELPKETGSEKKEIKITKCPDDVPTAIFDCLATITECDRLKLTKEEAARMSESITQLFGKHLGGWMWWTLILVISILGKLAQVWQCLNKKKDKNEQKDSVYPELKAPVHLENRKEKEAKPEDMVDIIINGRITTMPRSAAVTAGLIKATEA